MGLRFGFQGKLYYKVGGVAGGGAWLELTNAKDVTLNLEKGESDVTTRANAGWKATAPVLKDASIEFEMQWNTADAGFAAMKDSFFNDALIGIRALDGENGEGLQADMMVFNFSRKEQLTEAMSVAVSIKPTYSATPPTWVNAAA